MEKNIKTLLANIREFMDDSTIRKNLIEKYGEDCRFVNGLTKNEAIDELAACISEEDPEYPVKSEHLCEVMLADGSTIDLDGTIHHYPREELRIMGYDREKLQSMSNDEIYEEWCRAKGIPPSDDYVKDKTKAKKKELIDLGFTALKGAKFV